MRPTGETRVVLADRPGAGRTVLAQLVSETPGVQLVAKVSGPDEIEPAARELAADVVIVDDRLLRHGRWTGRDLGARLIVVGVDDDPGFVARARRIGAEAWIPKDRADSLLPLTMSRETAVTPRCRQEAAPETAGAARGSAP